MSNQRGSSENNSRGGQYSRHTSHTDQNRSPPQQYLTPDDVYRLEQEGYHSQYRSSETTSPRHSNTGSPGQRSHASSYSAGDPPRQAYSTTPTYAYQDNVQQSTSRAESQLDSSHAGSRHSPKNEASRSQSGSPKDSPDKGKEREKERDEQKRRRGAGDSRNPESRRGGNRRGGGPGASSGKLISGVFIRY